MRSILYKGAFCEFPEEGQIIAEVAGTDWVALVQSFGLEPERYTRHSFDGENIYIDFGYWSRFVVQTELD